MRWVGPLFKQFLWNMFHTTFCGFRAISWLFKGIYIRQRRNKMPGSYKGSVHCQKIMWRYKMDLVLQPSACSNFIMVHDSWLDPEYILSDTVTLYYITKDEAIFVECPPNVHVTSSNCSPFCE